MTRFQLIAISAVLLAPSIAFATIFGSVRGVVHDPQHRPIQGAKVTLKAQNSDWTQSQNSSNNGGFEFSSVPIGNYTVTVASKGFREMQQDVIVQSDTRPVLHFELLIAGGKETVNVEEIPVEATTDSVTPTTTVNRIDIQQTPGADRTNGMEMITDYVPATYVTHDMLHMRGGHQVNWLIDGVPIPNTNIANNLGPQIDPKDIDYLEVQRGSYDADYGDRTYGVFNVVPRTGFERYRECDLVITAGNFYQTNDQISCGGHTQRFAYYAQPEWKSESIRTADADRTGGQRCSERRWRIRFIHLQSRSQESVSHGYCSCGGIITRFRLIQIRIPSEIRTIPAPDCTTAKLSRMAMSRSPGFTLSIPILLLTVSPFYHYNGADYHGGPNDYSRHLHCHSNCQLRRHAGSCKHEPLEKRRAGWRLWIFPASVQLFL